MQPIYHSKRSAVSGFHGEYLSLPSYEETRNRKNAGNCYGLCGSGTFDSAVCDPEYPFCCISYYMLIEKLY